MISTLPLTATGLGANPANGYVFTWLDRSFGPNHDGHNIAVLHGKLPTTPATYAGEARMQARHTAALLVDVQQRRPAQRQNDRPVPRRRRGPDQRAPRLHDRGQPPAGPSDERHRQVRRGMDELGHDRRRLHPPALDVDGHAQPHNDRPPGVQNAVQNIVTPATVKQTMGAYLPTVSYTTAAKFQTHGCQTG